MAFDSRVDGTTDLEVPSHFVPSFSHCTYVLVHYSLSLETKFYLYLRGSK